MIYQAFILVFILLFAVVIHSGVIPQTIRAGIAAVTEGVQSLEDGLALVAQLDAQAIASLASFARHTGDGIVMGGKAIIRHLDFASQASRVNLALVLGSLTKPPETTLQAAGDSALPPDASPISASLAHYGTCDQRTINAIVAQSFLLYDFDRNLAVVSRNPDERWPMASLTKLMTSLVALESIELNRRITVSDSAASLEGNSGRIERENIFSLYDLVHAMLIPSSNRAAKAVAEARSEKNLIDAMQAKSRELGMRSTTYVEPTGLSFLNQSTANDLYKLASYIIRHRPEILTISRKPTADITELRSGEKRTIQTVNAFAGSPNLLGGKTGFTDEARRNLIGIFRFRNDIMVSIVLGSDDAFAATQKLLSCAQ